MKPNYFIFWGGTDVDSRYYNQPNHPYSDTPDFKRDTQEMEKAKQLIKDGIPLIGVCRGAQLLNIINGGILVQHIEGHGHSHLMDTYDKQQLLVNSTHHQMMVPGKEAEILGVCNTPTMGCTNPVSTKLHPIEKVYEVLYYPKTKCICVQFHPEWLQTTSLAKQWIEKEIKQRFNLESFSFSNQTDKYYGNI